MALIQCHECRGQVSNHARTWLLILAVFTFINALAQTPEPELAQIKIAADAGDPAAQDKLAERFIMLADSAQAEVWYRKAAVQGYVHAQGKLGDMLLMHYRMILGLKPDARAALGQEALKWVGLAASQGDNLAEEDLASICLEGKLVKPDLIDAYKWGELASEGYPFNPSTIMGKSIRDAAILKMNADQIAEARKRVAEFVPHQPQKSDLPEPALVQQIKLGGINGTPDHLIAIINGKTFEKGDQATVTIDGKKVTLSCLEVRATSVSISIEGIDGTHEIKLSNN